MSRDEALAEDERLERKERELPSIPDRRTRHGASAGQGIASPAVAGAARDSTVASVWRRKRHKDTVRSRRRPRPATAAAPLASIRNPVAGPAVIAVGVAGLRPIRSPAAESWD